jgi:hypothetical protein
LKARDGASMLHGSFCAISVISHRPWPAERLLPAIGEVQPANALDQALLGIEARYRTRTADFVAMQLEYPRPRTDLLNGTQERKAWATSFQR